MAAGISCGFGALAACGSEPAASPGEDASVADSSVAPALPDATPDAVASCTPGQVFGCSAEDRLALCNEGGVRQEIGCPFGCTAGESPRCREFKPHAPLVREDLRDQGLREISFASPVTIDTDSGEISGVRAVNGNPREREIRDGIRYHQESNAGVFVFGRLTVEAGVAVRIRGRRGLVLASTSDLELAGVIDARPYDGAVLCGRDAIAAGGFLGGRPRAIPNSDGKTGMCGGGGAPESTFWKAIGGGGGGGGSEYGGVGALASESVGMSGPGGAAGGAMQLGYPLKGGCGGGAGTGGQGGAGGGVVHLAAAGTLTVGSDAGRPLGGINVSGCGGMPGGADPTQSAGGAGAGGSIAMEAAFVVLRPTAALVANGGGGGGGASEGQVSGFSAAACLGGEASASVTRGGAGGAASEPRGETPAQPEAAEGTFVGGGGGGGGIGWIAFYDADGVVDAAATALLSPSFGTRIFNGSVAACVQDQLEPLD